MEHLPIQSRFGDPATGIIEEGSGFGTRGTGRDLRDLEPIGCLAIGKREGEVGSGEKAAGSTDS
jgi:hypothetical protein